MMMKRFFFFLLALSLCSAAFCQEFAVPDRPKAPGEVRVLCIGNSFTYVCHTDSMLQDISRSQGLELQIGKYLHGGRTFGQHLLTLTMRHPSCARTRRREATIPARGGFSPAEALCKAFLSVYPRSVT